MQYVLIKQKAFYREWHRDGVIYNSLSEAKRAAEQLKPIYRHADYFKPMAYLKSIQGVDLWMSRRSQANLKLVS